jgi:hypothetical protein
MRRNRALKAAFWRCQGCGSKQNLEVHHKAYERLGCEADADLEVLCGECHSRTHDRQEQFSVRLYYKLASDLLERDRSIETSADLSEALKVQCARLRIKYDHDGVQQAVVALGARIRISARVTYVPPPERPDRPMSKAEASAVMARMFHGYPLAKTMPRVDPSIWHQEEDPYIERPLYVSGSEERY